MPFALPSILTRIIAHVRQHLHRTILVAGIFVLLLIVAIEGFTGNLPHVLTTLRNDLQPQGYTELAFNNTAELPKKANNETVLNFSFSIHNAEGQITSYPYIVAVKSGNTITGLDSGRITLQNDQWITRPESVRLFNVAPIQQIFVFLPTKQQTINFWVKGVTL